MASNNIRRRRLSPGSVVALARCAEPLQRSCLLGISRCYPFQKVTARLRIASSSTASTQPRLQTRIAIQALIFSRGSCFRASFFLDGTVFSRSDECAAQRGAELWIDLAASVANSNPLRRGIITSVTRRSIGGSGDNRQRLFAVARRRRREACLVQGLSGQLTNMIFIVNDGAGTRSADAIGIGLFVSLLLAFWSSWSATGMLMTAVNTCYGVEETRRFVRFNLDAVALTTGLALFGFAALALLAVVPAILDLLPVSGMARETIALVRWPLLVGIAMLALAIVYRYAPTGSSRHGNG